MLQTAAIVLRLSVFRRIECWPRRDVKVSSKTGHAVFGYNRTAAKVSQGVIDPFGAA